MLEAAQLSDRLKEVHLKGIGVLKEKKLLQEFLTFHSKLEFVDLSENNIGSYTQMDHYFILAVLEQSRSLKKLYYL